MATAACSAERGGEHHLVLRPVALPRPLDQDEHADGCAVEHERHVQVGAVPYFSNDWRVDAGRSGSE